MKKPKHGAANLIRARFDEVADQLPLRQRIDAVLIGLSICIFLAYVLIGPICISFAHRWGWLEQPLIQELPDRRILHNLRDDLPETMAEKDERHRLLLDAVPHSDGRLYISQQGGTVYRYQMKTGIWNQENVDIDLNVNFRVLRSGCGNDPHTGLPIECWDRRSVWGVSENQGLARRHRGEWKVVVGDTAFLGWEGNELTTNDLSCAAISADKQWLAVGTKNDGMGLYHLPSSRWIPWDSSAREQGLKRVDQVRWWRGYFWQASSAGLARIRPDFYVDKVSRVFSGEVLDLAVGPRDDRQPLDIDSDPGRFLWVLLDLGNRLSIHKWESPSSDLPPPVFDQGEWLKQLSQAKVDFAQYDPSLDLLALAGEAGLVTYNTRLHSWYRSEDSPIPVTATLAEPSKRAFYFGYRQGIGSYRKGKVIRHDLGDHIISMTGADGRVFALARSGAIYTTNKPGQVPVKAFPGDRTFLNPARFKTGAGGVGDHVLLTGSEGLLHHDLARRTYRSIAKEKLPNWMAEADQIINSGDRFFFKSGTDTQTFHMIEADDLQKDLSSLKAIAHSISGPGKANAWPDESLLAVDGQGTAFGLGGIKVQYTGSPDPGLVDAKIIDVVAGDQGLYALTARSIVFYDYRERRWRLTYNHVGNDLLTELDQIKGQLFVRTDQDRLLDISEDGTALIGASKLPFGDRQLSDVMVRGDKLYLASKKEVVSYNLAFRHMESVWEQSSADDRGITLHGLVGDQPLYLHNGRAWAGNSPYVGQINHPIVNLSTDGDTVWAVHQKGSGQRYLRIHEESRSKCFFYNSEPPGDPQSITDVKTLDNGWLVMATEKGLRFYNPEVRSWYAGPKGLRNIELVYLLYGHLVMAPPSLRGTAYVVRQSEMRFPESCEDGRVDFNYQYFSIDGNLAMDSDKRVAWLQDGSVYEVNMDRPFFQKPTGVIESPVARPRLSELKRFWEVKSGNQNYLVFAKADALTIDALAIYDVKARTWDTCEWNLANVVDVDLSWRGGDGKVLLRTRNNRWYQSDFRPTQAKLNPKPIPQQSEFFDESAGDFLDLVKLTDGRWLFVLRNGLAFFDPIDRTWQKRSLPRDPGRKVLKMASQVIVKDSNDLWRLVSGGRGSGLESYQLKREEKTAVDDSSRIWRLTPQGSILRQGSFSSTAGVFQHAFLVPRGVNTAFQEGDYVVFSGASQTAIMDKRDGSDLTPDRLKTEAIIGVKKIFGGVFWMWSKDRIFRVNLDPVRVDSEDRYQKLIFDKQDDPWILDQGTWKKWDGRFKDAGNRNGTRIRVFPTRERDTVYLDDNGFVYVGRGGRFRSEGELPQSIAISDVEHLYRDNNGNWWVFTSSRLILLEDGDCSANPDDPYEPCILEKCSWRLGNLVGSDFDPVLHIQEDPKGLGLTNRSGSRSILATYECQEEDFTPRFAAYSLANTWNQISTKVDPSSRVFDPYIDFSEKNRGLFGVRRSGEETFLATNGAYLERDHPALDVDWLVWDRGARVFKVAGSSRDFAPADFIKNGRLLFEPFGAAHHDTNNLNIANEHGIWLYPKGNPQLNQNLTFTPVSLPGRIVSAHGSFLADGIVVEASNGNRGQATRSVQFSGILNVVEDKRTGNLQATLPNHGNQSAFRSVGGFRWDYARTGLAYLKGDLYMNSEIGLVSLDENLSYDLGPAPGALQNGTIYPVGRNLVMLESLGSWSQYSNGNWSPMTQNPLRSRNLTVRSSYWSWRMADNRPVISFSSDAFDFDFLGPKTSKTLGMNSDVLLDATIHEGKGYVMTRAFRETTSNVKRLEDFSASRQPPEPTVDLISLHEGTGGRVMYRFDGRQYFPWNGKGFGNPINRSPRANRITAEYSRLKFKLDGAVPRKIVKQLRMTHRDGRDYWATYSLVKGRFPFDKVNTIAAAENKLFVGTAAGVQVYGDLSQFALRGMSRLEDMKLSAAGKPVSVSYLGYPSEFEGFTGIAGGNGFIWSDPGQPGEYKKSMRRSDRMRLAESWWYWYQDGQSKQLNAYYRDQSGNSIPHESLLNLRDGRFPHDRLVEVVHQDKHGYSLDQGGMIIRYQGARLALDDSVQLYSSERDATELLVVNQDIDWNRTTLARGVYYEGQKGDFYRFDGTRWLPQSQNENSDLAYYQKNPPISVRKRLRLLASPKGPFFQRRTVSGEWLPLDWMKLTSDSENADQWRLDLDHILAFHQVGDQYVASTPVGLVPFQFRNKSLVLNPDSFWVVPGPSETPMIATEMASRKDGVLVRFQHSSDLLYEGMLDGLRDSSVYQKYTGADPFASETWVTRQESECLTVTRQGRTNGNPGQLQFQLHGESAELSVGRFSFDRINSLAHLKGEQMEVVSEGTGWYSVDGDSLHLKNFLRPDMPADLAAIPKNVSRVGLSFNGKEVALLLTTNGDTTNHYHPDQRKISPLASREYQAGANSLWRYSRAGKDLVIDTASGARRRMERGRFTDDIVLGPPTAARVDQEKVYLFPTRAGVMVTDPHFEEKAVHGIKPDGNQDLALWMWDAQTPAFTRDGGVYPLFDPESKALLNFSLPPKARLVAMEAGPQDHVRFRYQVDSQQGWILVPKQQGNRKPLVRAHDIDISGYKRFQANRHRWGYPESWVQVNYEDPGYVRFASDKKTKKQRIDGAILASVVYFDELILVFQNQAMVINLEEAAMQLYKE